MAATARKFLDGYGSVSQGFTCSIRFLNVVPPLFFIRS